MTLTHWVRQAAKEGTLSVRGIPVRPSRGEDRIVLGRC
jgi:hypothetical protein